MAPLTYIDCVHCQGRGFRFVVGCMSPYDNRAATEPCAHCLGRGWMDIMQQHDECKICGGYGWGKVGEHAVAFLKGTVEHDKCRACHGTGRKQSEERIMEKAMINVEGAITEGVGSGIFPKDCGVTKEAVVHPSHYNSGKIEVIDAIEDWKLGFNDGNAVKYIGRHRMKGTPQADLEKAIWYLTRELMKVHRVSVERLVGIVQTCVKDVPGTR